MCHNIVMKYIRAYIREVITIMIVAVLLIGLVIAMLLTTDVKALTAQPTSTNIEWVIKHLGVE